MIEILKNDHVIRAISHVLTASICDKLDGTLTFDFTVLQENCVPLLPGMAVRYDGQYYDIVRVKRGFTSGIEISTISCEHISYTLNSERYNLVTFVFEGTPLQGLAELLAGTPFSVGVVEPTAMVECAFTDSSPLNRRSALMRFADACGGELEYSGFMIHIRTHRGSRKRIALMDGTNVTGLCATYDSRKETQAYEIQLFKRTPLSVGDEVRIVYRPLSIETDTRIVGMTYNPFNAHSVRVEVGDYVPNLLAAETKRVNGIRQEFRAANGKMESKIESVEDGLSSLTQTVRGFDTRIENAEGAVSTLSQTVNSFQTRIQTAEGNISSLTQTAGKIDWLIKSGTSASNFTMTDRAIKLVADKIDLSGYVTISALGTAGKTTINAGNITTGTIDASKVTVTNLQINNVKYGTYPVITCTGTYGNPNIAVGKDQMSNSVSPTKLSLYGTTINVGDETSTLYTVNISGGYVKIVGGSYVNIGTSSYYAVMNNSREFRPSTSSSSYPFYLGTSGYPWHYGNIGTLNVVTSAKLGTTTGAKVGFFGTTPIGRKAVSRATGSTVASCNTAINNLITALKAYGLIS